MTVKPVNVADGVDRIGSLPDGVLRHILSFLPTKAAVSSCVLSTRWRYLFPFSNNLDFDESLVFNPRGNDQSQDDRTGCFLNFVDRCITLMDATLVDKFRLKCTRYIDPSRVNSWICAAPLHNVRELDLWGTPPRELWKKPLFIFTSSALVVLKLGANFTLNVPASVDLPCLKSLHLDRIRFADDISIQRLFSSCPVIEDLVIQGCSMGYIRVLNLSSPSLKRLTLQKGIFILSDLKLVLDAPNLVYLKFTMSAGQGYTLLNLHSLSEAHISFGDTYGHSDDIPLSEFLEGISSVQTLFISDSCGDLLTLDLDGLPILENLTRLVLTGPLSLLMKLLRCTPNLGEFFFDGGIQDAQEDGCVDVPSCVSSRLMEIDYMVYYDGLGFERGAGSIEYFLKNANVLKKMCIRINGLCSDEVVDEKAMMMVETVKRLVRSKTCEVTFFLKVFHTASNIHAARWVEL